MKMNRILPFVLLMGSTTALCVNAVAQDTNTESHTITITVPAVALLDLESGSSKDLTASYTAPDEAGDPIVAPAANATIWLNYSSIQTGSTTKIVTVSATPLIAGLDINLLAAAPTGGSGTLGTPSSSITLTTTDQTLVSGIGSGYTDTGVSNGCLLTYSFEANTTNYASIRSGTPTAVVVTYTLADDI